MKLQREKWTPLTIIIETEREAEILHKVLGAVSDETKYTDGDDMLYRLFMALGNGLGGNGLFKVTGEIKVENV